MTSTSGHSLRQMPLLERIGVDVDATARLSPSQ
jgi:hypothetical protein